MADELGKGTPPFRVSGVAASNSNTSLQEVFENRKKYNSDVFPESLINNVAFTWGKDRFYGKINTRGNAIVPNGIFLKPLKYTNGQQDYYAMNFVADAWRDLAERLRSLAASNVIYQDSVWAAPVIERAYVSPSLVYDDYMKSTIFSTVTTFFLPQAPRNKKVRDFDSFLEQMGDFLHNVIQQEGVLTRSGAIESLYTPPYTTGLVIEIASSEYDNDRIKAQKFGDLNFGLVANIAAQYGFSIDRNIPWRLVADISSKAMQEYMTGVPISGIEGDFRNDLTKCRDILRKDPGYLPDFYGYSQIPGFEDVKRHVSGHLNENLDLVPGYIIYQPIKTAATQKDIAEIIFNSAYNETYLTDMAFLSAYFANFYNSYVSASPLITDYVPIDEYDPAIATCKSRTVSIRRFPLPAVQDTIGTAVSRYNFKWSYKTFYQVRMAERNKKLDFAVHLKNIRDMTNLYDFAAGVPIQRYNKTLKYIQDNFIGPFQTKFLNLDKMGDLYEEQGLVDESVTERTYDAVSNPGQQERVRGGVY